MTARIVAGLVGGIVAGLVFGAMMHALGSIAMIGALIGAEGVVTGWIVHLIIAAAIGIAYALVVGPLRPGYGAAVVTGLLYGAVWWVLGPLLLMPLFLGMDPFPAIEQQQIMSLIGHLAYGLVLGIVYVAVRDRTPQQHRTDPARGRDTRSNA